MSLESFESRLRGEYGYSQEPMNPPPAEKKENVLQLSLTEGCSHGRCTFCSMYRSEGKSYKAKTPQDFKTHVDGVFNYLKRHPFKLRKIDRIFLGAGNALSADLETLFFASQYALIKLYLAKNGEVPRRLSLYGNTRDILEKKVSGISHLWSGEFGNRRSLVGQYDKRKGVDLIYWGIESGSNKVLKIAGKNCNQDEIMKAGAIVQNGGAEISATIIPGLGGIEYAEKHTEDTIKVLNYIRPKWVTFSGLQIYQNTPYYAWMRREEERGRNRRLTALEMTEQTAQMIEGINFITIVGVHGDGVHAFGQNPNSFGSRKIYTREESGKLAKELRVGKKEASRSSLLSMIRERKIAKKIAPIDPMQRFYYSI